MDKQKLLKLKQQFLKVVPLLGDEYKKSPTPMLELILKRYKNTLDIINSTELNNIKQQQFHVKGGVRAYLDNSSNYDEVI